MRALCAPPGDVKTETPDPSAVSSSNIAARFKNVVLRSAMLDRVRADCQSGKSPKAEINGLLGELRERFQP